MNRSRAIPLRLVTPKSRARTHSIHDNQPVLSRADRDDVWIHTADAAARGIIDGQPVRVFNARGATRLPARVTDRIAPGVVSIKEGRLVHAGRNGLRHARVRQRAHGRPDVARGRGPVQLLLRGRGADLLSSSAASRIGKRPCDNSLGGCESE